jgi:hypothetical protein
VELKEHAGGEGRNEEIASHHNFAHVNRHFILESPRAAPDSSRLTNHRSEFANMQRTISSSLTFFSKFIGPAIFFLILALWLPQLFISGAFRRDNSGSPAPPHSILFFLFVLFLAGTLSYWFGIRLKKVSMTDDALYISNYRKEIRVPFGDIAAVSENRFISGHPVWIEFRHTTDFGNRILFMPKWIWLTNWRSHPIVAELRQAALRAPGGSALRSRW